MAKAERVLHDYEVAPVGNPLSALQALAGRALALERAIGDIVNDLGSIRYEATGGGEQLRAEVAVLERAMDRAGRLLVDIAKLNIDDRLVRLGEEQGRLIAAVLKGTLDDLGVSYQDPQVSSALMRRLRAVSPRDG